MRKILFGLILSLLCAASFSQVQPIAASRMQTTTSGVMQNKMASRGFASNDPRWGATLSSAGAALGVAAGAAVTVTAGAATAPAWITAGIAIGMSYAVSLAADGLLNWIFDSDGTVTVPANASPNSYAAPYRVMMVYCVTSVCDVSLQAACARNNSQFDGATRFLGGEPYVFGSQMQDGQCHLYYRFLHIPAESGGSLGSTYQLGCVGINLGASNGMCPASNFPVPTPTKHASPSQAVAALSPEQKKQPLNPSIISDLANQAWSRAAAAPGYAGLPYNAADPITAADVNAFRVANPASYPSVGDAVAPQPAPSGGTASSPFGLPNGGTGASPGPGSGASPTPTTPTNPSTQPLTNLGPDPGIGAPLLEATPTAQMILAPLLGLFPSVKSFVVPRHSSVCPKPDMTLFGSTLVLDAHCNVLDPLRDVLSAAMAFAWALVSLFIVLRA